MRALRASLRALLVVGYLLALATLAAPDPVGFFADPPLAAIVEVTLGFLLVTWAVGWALRRG